MEQSPFPLVSDGGGLFRFARPVVSAGRLPDPTKPDELFVDRSYADDAGVEIGDRMRWRIVHTDKLTEFFTSGDDRSIAEVTGSPDFGVPITMTVVGIGTALDSLVVDEGFEPQGVYATPAFMDTAPDPIAPYWGAFVRLTDPSEVEAFRTAVDALVPDELVVYQTFEATRPKLERAISPGAVTLLAFGLVAAAVGPPADRPGDLPPAAARRPRRRRAGRARDDAAGALRGRPAPHRRGRHSGRRPPAGSSPGCSRRPPRPVRGAASSRDPGFHVDAVVLGLGVALTIVFVVAVAAPIAWRNARVSASAMAPGRSFVGRWLASSRRPAVGDDRCAVRTRAGPRVDRGADQSHARGRGDRCGGGRGHAGVRRQHRRRRRDAAALRRRLDVRRRVRRHRGRAVAAAGGLPEGRAAHRRRSRRGGVQCGRDHRGARSTAAGSRRSRSAGAGRSDRRSPRDGRRTNRVRSPSAGRR